MEVKLNDTKAIFTPGAWARMPGHWQKNNDVFRHWVLHVRKYRLAPKYKVKTACTRARALCLNCYVITWKNDWIYCEKLLKVVFLTYYKRFLSVTRTPYVTSKSVRDSVWCYSVFFVAWQVLCLANGERIGMGHGMRILFEVDNLAMASPATVSRCGMVYMVSFDVTQSQSPTSHAIAF